MSFGIQMKHYLDKLEITAKKLSEVTGISPSQISKYINNKRTPRYGSVQYNAIIDAICTLSGFAPNSREADEIRRAFEEEIPAKGYKTDAFIFRLNLIIQELKINVSDLAYSMNYDASFISRIKNGTRAPSDPEGFSQKVASYITRHYNSDYDFEKVSTVTGIAKTELTDEENYAKQIKLWLLSIDDKSKEVEEFLHAFNESIVNLADTVGEQKLPSSPIMPKITKHYYGIDGMKKAEADFFRYTVLSQSKRRMFLYSDIPMKEVDSDQFDKLVKAVNALITKGISLDLIHNINRPVSEMLLGLKGWLPLYIKGNINPYYFESTPVYMMSQILAVSGSAAMQGECISNNQETTMLTTTTSKKQVEYYNKKADYLLSLAKPLMTIYREGEESKFLKFLEEEKGKAKITTCKKDGFDNIDFYINSGKWVSVNKIESPKVHFVIHNCRLVNSIEELLS